MSRMALTEVEKNLTSTTLAQTLAESEDLGFAIFELNETASNLDKIGIKQFDASSKTAKNKQELEEIKDERGLDLTVCLVYLGAFFAFWGIDVFLLSDTVSEIVIYLLPKIQTLFNDESAVYLVVSILLAFFYLLIDGFVGHSTQQLRKEVNEYEKEERTTYRKKIRNMKKPNKNLLRIAYVLSFCLIMSLPTLNMSYALLNSGVITDPQIESAAYYAGVLRAVGVFVLTIVIHAITWAFFGNVIESITFLRKKMSHFFNDRALRKKEQQTLDIAAAVERSLVNLQNIMRELTGSEDLKPISNSFSKETKRIVNQLYGFDVIPTSQGV